MRILLSFVFCGLVASSGNAYAPDPLNPVAERYAHLVLALGQHDPDYVDAFYGPSEWKTQAEKEKEVAGCNRCRGGRTNRRFGENSYRWRRPPSIAARISAEANFRAGGAGIERGSELPVATLSDWITGTWKSN